MKLRPRILVVGGLLALAGAALFLLWLWQPERQVKLHQKHLIGAVSDRNWKKVGRFLSPDYEDHWGFTRETAPQAGAQVFRHFFSLTVRAESEGLSVSKTEATIFNRLSLDGAGSAIAQEVVRRVNRLRRPFRFEWRRASSRPWDWQLVSVDQQELIIPEAAGYF